MPLTADQELLEHQLRAYQMQTNIQQMELNIEKMRADIRNDGDKLRNEIRRDTRTFIYQFVSASVGLLLAGAAIGHFFIK